MSSCSEQSFMAEIKKCEKCGKEYLPTHQSAKCPHERLIDIEPTDEGGLLTEADYDSLEHGGFKPYYYEVRVALEAQRDLIASIKDARYMQATKDDRAGKPLALTEREFEIYCAIKNIAIAQCATNLKGDEG